MDPEDYQDGGTPPPDFETRSEFRSIIDALRSAPGPEPPGDLGLRVMAEISRRPQTAVQRPAVAAPILRLRRILSQLIETASSREVALCFILAGFFYLVLGLVLYIGLQMRVGPGAVTGWVWMQPYVALFFAAGLGGLGILILNDGRTALRVAQAGSVVYILFSLLNVFFLQVSPDRPFNVYGLLCFTAGSLLLGVFLTAAVRKFWQQAFCAANPCA